MGSPTRSVKRGWLNIGNSGITRDRVTQYPPEVPVPRLRRSLAALAAFTWMLAAPASAEEAVCGPVAKVPLERHLRQLSLDLLGRPPTIEEYRAYQAKGSISAEDIR